jgi:hypothetical protein
VRISGKGLVSDPPLCSFVSSVVKVFAFPDVGDDPMSRDPGVSATFCLRLSARNPTRLLMFCCKQKAKLFRTPL